MFTANEIKQEYDDKDKENGNEQQTLRFDNQYEDKYENPFDTMIYIPEINAGHDLLYKQEHSDIKDDIDIIDIEHEKQQYKCNKCEYESEFYCSYLIHIETHKYTCEICCKVYESELELQTHLRLNGKNSCIICAKEFINICDLNQHINKHPVGRGYMCKFCHRMYNSALNLIVHIKRECKSCHRTSKKILREKKSIDTEIEQYECYLCKDKFYHREDFIRHKVSQHPKLPYECIVCHEMFKRRCELWQHDEIIHQTEKHSICTICFKRFPRPVSLRKHMVVHLSHYDYKCNYCDGRFKRDDLMRRHVSHMHGRRKFACKICHKICNWKHGLLSHLDRHTLAERVMGNNIFLCGVCDEEFVTEGHLEDHVEMHTLVDRLKRQRVYLNTL